MGKDQFSGVIIHVKLWIRIGYLSKNELDSNEWNQINDKDVPEARPGQRAVFYGGQLLIVDWNYSNDVNRRFIKVQEKG